MVPPCQVQSTGVIYPGRWSQQEWSTLGGAVNRHVDSKEFKELSVFFFNYKSAGLGRLDYLVKCLLLNPEDLSLDPPCQVQSQAWWDMPITLPQGGRDR